MTPTRAFIKKAGFADQVMHRTGHSIDNDLQGGGADLDDFEVKDTRILTPGTGFTVGPGLYFAGQFGVRTEVSVYLAPAAPRSRRRRKTTSKRCSKSVTRVGATGRVRRRRADPRRRQGDAARRRREARARRRRPRRSSSARSRVLAPRVAEIIVSSRAPTIAGLSHACATGRRRRAARRHRRRARRDRARRGCSWSPATCRTSPAS